MKILWLLIFVPLCVALGYDFYLFFQKLGPNYNIATSDLFNDLLVNFQFADLGFIWTTFSPDTFEYSIKNTPDSIWKIISFFLKQSNVVLSVGFIALIAILTTLITFARAVFLFFKQKPQDKKKKTKSFEKMNESERLEFLANMKRKFYHFLRNK